MRSRPMIVFVLVLALTAIACELPVSEPAVDTIGTSVAATVAAGAGGDSEANEEDMLISAPEELALDVCPRAAALTITYIDGGNVWVLPVSDPALQLTSGGNTAAVAISGDGAKIAYTTSDENGLNQELHIVNTDGSGETTLLNQRKSPRLCRWRLRPLKTPST